MQILGKIYHPNPLIKAWIKLIRLQNIIILAAIFILLHIGVYLPVYNVSGVVSPLNGWVYGVFVLSVCFVAAGGNIINDYFDFEIDAINKPQKLVIGKEISNRQAMTGYLVMTISGIAGGFLTGWLLGFFKMGFFFGFGAILLYTYSETFKRKLLIGNLIIALLGFLSVVLLWIVEFFALRNSAGSFVIVYSSFLNINFLMGGYAFFAFLTTLIREIIKDIEDVEGDKANGCRTLPVSLGVKTSRSIVVGIIIFTFLILIPCQIYCWKYNMRVLAAFIAPAIQLQLMILLFRFLKAETKADYHAASTAMKWVMVAGILGIQLINLHV